MITHTIMIQYDLVRAGLRPKKMINQYKFVNEPYLNAS
jgi:hypothetical protein